MVDRGFGLCQEEHAGIIGKNGETFNKPEELINDSFLMFYDISLELNNKPMTGIGTNLSFEGKNNNSKWKRNMKKNNGD